MYRDPKFFKWNDFASFKSFLDSNSTNASPWGRELYNGHVIKWTPSSPFSILTPVKKSQISFLFVAQGNPRMRIKYRPDLLSLPLFSCSSFDSFSWHSSSQTKRTTKLYIGENVLLFYCWFCRVSNYVYFDLTSYILLFFKYKLIVLKTFVVFILN